MKMLRRIPMLLLMALLIFSSCQKDTDHVNVDGTVINPPNIIVNASVLGSVYNQAGEPIVGATVSMGNNSTFSDENGAFVFNNKTMNQYGQYIKVEKEGYFMNGKFVEPGLAERALVQVKMIERSLTGSFSSTGVGTVTFEGAKVDFSSNSFVDAAGNPYSGNVNVYATRLTAEDNDFAQIPGDLRAISSGNEIVQLETYGMIGVELIGDSGQKLNIAEGQKATITIPISHDQLSNAPDEIPLWYMNETTGYWMEEGTATKQGNQYVGEVTHFSFWNCDYPYPLVQLSGAVTLNEIVVIPWLTVKITINATGLTAYTILDENGAFTGKVPKDEDLTLEIFNSCNELMYTENLGSLSNDTSLPTIDIINSSVVAVTGNLIKCDMSPVTNGYAAIGVTNSLLFPTDANGYFSTNWISCNPHITAKGFDIDELKTSQESSHDLTGLSNLDLGEIEVCDDVIEFINFNINGESFTLFDPYLDYNFVDLNFFQLAASAQDSTDMIIFIDNMTSEGTFVPIASQFNGLINGQFTLANCQPCTGFELTIDEILPVGELMTGSFSGTMDSNVADNVSITGSFSVYRDN